MNDLSQIQVFEIFRTSLFLATHSETNCSSLLSVAVISLTVVADVYSVESSACKASSMLLVKVEKKVRGLDRCRGEFLILP